MLSGLSANDRTMMRDALRGTLEDRWPSHGAVARSQEASALGDIWGLLARDGYAALGFDEAGSGLTEAVLIAAELGRAGCPAPFAASFLLNLAVRQAGADGSALAALHGGRIVPAVAFGTVDGDSGAGGVSIDGDRLSGTVRFVEAVPGTTHILALAGDRAALVPVEAASLRATPGLAVPPLSDVTFAGAPATILSLDARSVEALASIARLLLAARAVGAARRGHEMVVEYVQQRHQFGQPLSAFQAMQHKLANAAVMLQAAERVIDGAADAYDREIEEWRFYAAAAFAYASPSLRDVILETHHAFGAIGYAEEHELPRHFRRVHADLLRMGGPRRANEELADHFLAGGHAGFPEYDPDQATRDFRQEVRAWLASRWTDEGRTAEKTKPMHLREWNQDFAKAMGKDGWISLAWPKEHGGAGRSPREQLVFIEELHRANAPVYSMMSAAFLVAPAIIGFGSEQLQAEFLPGIKAGDISFSLGYSEPEAGSDLASLRTRAVRDGDDYLITGQKVWGTGQDKASHVILATRTDPNVKKHLGISLFLVPLNAPGVQIIPGKAMYGRTFSTQFYDNVRVPASSMLGQENGGWKVLTSALAAERILMGGNVVNIRRLFEDVADHVRASPDLCGDSAIRELLGRFAAELNAARALVLASIEAMEEGRTPIVEGAITKVFSGGLTERFCEAVMEILGTAGLFDETVADAPLGGETEQRLRQSLMMVIGGGAAEVQRGLIARNGLGVS